VKRAALVLGLWFALNASQRPVDQVDDALIQSAAMPEKLSAFRLVNGLHGNVGVKPYTLNTALFSDYAEKWRYLYVPNGARLSWSGEGLPRFPIGAVLIKSFGYPADFRQPEKDIRLLETRLLIHRASGWVALPYVWDADGKDATLRRAGTRIAVNWTHSDGVRREISYAVPNVNQCKGCHDEGGKMTPIGPKARNIATGIAHPEPARPLPRWDDPNKPVDARARAYLDVNCGHCHNKAGPANTSGLWLDWDQKADVNLGFGKRPTAAGRGSGDREVAIAPGHPDKSILIYRMESLDPGIAMPELGRATVHREAVAMLSEWIKTSK
jgi:hypothetical protein